MPNFQGIVSRWKFGIQGLGRLKRVFFLHCCGNPQTAVMFVHPSATRRADLLDIELPEPDLSIYEVKNDE